MNFHPIENSTDTAKAIVPILIEWYNPASVLDLGCNTGAWLHQFIKNGVTDVMGVDGDNMLSELRLPEANFMVADLTIPINLKRKYDLVLCLEVAEHLDQQYADVLIDTAINHSDNVFWSAATVGQTGYNHVNEQPLEYWIEKFNDRGYYGRCLADKLPEVTHDYYRKNAIEFIKVKL
jgi:SAM-dependent methyltransferase